MDHDKNFNRTDDEAEQESRKMELNKSIVIPVIEEHVHIAKKIIESGRVRISKTVSEEAQTVSIPLTSEEFNVERVAVNQYLDEMPPAVRYEGETIIIPVLKEVAVVQKRIMLIEELRITKRHVQREETHHVSVRKEHVNVVRSGIDNPNETEL